MDATGDATGDGGGGGAWPAYLINLDGDAGRLAAAGAQLDAAGVAWERLPAVDGRALTPQARAVHYDAAANARRGRHRLVPAEIGCYLSHLAAWRRIAEGAAPGGAVFEDDLAAGPDLGDALTALAADRGADWDMAKLFALEKEPRVRRARPLGNGLRLAHPARVPTTTLGYAVTRAGARRLVERRHRFFRPVDEDLKFEWETGVRVALVLPPPLRLGCEASAAGTIGAERRSAAGGGLGRLLRGIGYQVDYRLRRAAHRRGAGR